MRLNRVINAVPTGFESSSPALPRQRLRWVGDREELTQLRRLHATLSAEIKMVAESLEQLRASPDYELCQLAGQKNRRAG